MASYFPRSWHLRPQGPEAANCPFGCARPPTSRKITVETMGPPSSRCSSCAKTVPKPICLAYRELLFEREQPPQAVDNKHFRIELIEHLEPVMVLRNQQVAGSTAVGVSRRLYQIPIMLFSPVSEPRFVIGPAVQARVGLAFYL
jgi:hypothetical protein